MVVDHSFLLKKYEFDIKSSNSAFNAYRDAPKRGADFAAACKRYKQKICFAWLKEIEKNDGADLTPTIAKHIIRKWIGRSVSPLVLNEFFGTVGRTASDKSLDACNVDYYAEKYRDNVERDIEKGNSKMLDARKLLKQESK